jgi:O-antigen/teichoic acid export membrane protein
MSADQDFSGLKKAAVNGAIWTVGSYGLTQAIRFFSNLILTRLLFPELFGLMSLVNIFIMGLALLSDVGINQSIVRSKKGGDPDFLDTAWTIQVIRGAGLGLIAAIISYPLSQVYARPEIFWLLPIVGVSVVVSGFTSTGVAMTNRQMNVKKLVLFELCGQVIGISAMLLWAWLSPTIWALVAGTLTTTVVRTIASHWLVRSHRNRFLLNKEAVHELFSFGKWIFVSSVLTFLAGQVDRLILGKYLTLTVLGVYTIAFTLADLPKQIILALSDKVIFPSFSQMISLPRPEFRKRLLNNRKRLLFPAAIGLALLVSFGDVAIHILYDSRYFQAGWILCILAMGVWPNLMALTISPSLFALGKPLYVAAGNFLRFLCTLIGIPVGYALYGIPGAVVAVAMNDLFFYAAIQFGVNREGVSSIRQDLLGTLIFLGTVVILVLSRWVLGFGLPINGL